MEFRYDNGFGTHFASSFQIHRELKDKGMFPKTSGLRNLMNEQLEWGGAYQEGSWRWEILEPVRGLRESSVF